MLKCAPYIKNLCSSLQSGLWKEGGPGGSLPGSPIKRAKNNPNPPPSPTRSEGAGEGNCELQYEKSKKGLEAISMPTLVGHGGNTLIVTCTERGDQSEVITSVVRSDLTNVLRKLRPESPDVTRAAKKLELANNVGSSPTSSSNSGSSSSSGASTGAISKVKRLQQPQIQISSPTASTSSTASTTSSSATAVK